MTAIEIERYSRTEMWKKFPYADCRWLQANAAAGTGLTADLNTYFADIAGFASSASELRKRNQDQLERAEQRLKSSFFKLYPSYKLLADKINEHNTPELDKLMRAADLIRSELVPILHGALCTKKGSN
jgi:hypothetical protein